MIGVLIFAGIVGYGIVYSGLADIQLGKGKVTIARALLGAKGGPAKARPSSQQPRVGRKI